MNINSDFKKVFSLHGDYTEALKEWQKFQNDSPQKVALWSSIFWTFQNAKYVEKAKGMDVNRQMMRLAVDLPGESDWDEWIAGVVGFDSEKTDMSEIISGKKDIELWYDKISDDEDWPPFVEFGRKMWRKRSQVEFQAQQLHNYMFYGDENNTASDISDGQRCKFQKKFAGINDYEAQISTTKILTKELGKSQMGREILSKLLNPYYDKESKREYFTALNLFYPPAVWSGTFKDPLVNPPDKSDVGNDDCVLGMDGDHPYVKDRQLANKMTVLAGQLMPGVSHFQAKKNGDLWASNTQISSLVYMIDGGIDQHNWKAFKNYGRTYSKGDGNKAVKVFEHLDKVVGLSDKIVSQFEETSKQRYSNTSGNHKLYRSSFVNLFSLVGTTAGVVAKANEGELDFTPQGVYNAAQGYHTAANLYQDIRKTAGLEYDTVKLKNGEIVTEMSGDAAKWGDTVLEGAGKAFDVIDAFLSANTAVNAYEKGEYDVAVLAGVGTIIAVGGLFVGGWTAVLAAVVGMVIGYLTDWVTDSAITNWIERTVFGKKDISDDTNQNPNSDYFGFDGYKRVSPPKSGWSGKGGGLSRQISAFQSIMQPFDVSGLNNDNLIKIKKDKKGYKSMIRLENITGGSVGSAFIIQPIYKHGGEYKVGEVAQNIQPIIGIPSGYAGVNKKTWKGHETEIGNDVKLITKVTFSNGQSSVKDSNKAVENVGLNFSKANSVSDLFGFDPRNTDGESYLEILHLPPDFRESVGLILSELDTPASVEMIDAIVDLQPFPRQRIPVEVQE